MVVHIFYYVNADIVASLMKIHTEIIYIFIIVMESLSSNRNTEIVLTKLFVLLKFFV